MEHFDDMLRNTLANDYPENRFEFREEYWLQAQALIESYERKRKRRAIFWVFTGLLLTTAAVLYWYDGSQPEQTVPETPPAMQHALQQPMAVQEQSAPVANGTNEPALQPATAATAGQPASAISNTNKSVNYTKSNHTVQEHTINNTENKISTASTYGSSQKTALQTPQPGHQPDDGITSSRQPGAENTTSAPGRLTVQVAKTVESLAFQSVNSLLPAQQPTLTMLPSVSPDEMAASSSITKKAHEIQWHTGLTLVAGNSENLLAKDNFSVGAGIANQFKINQKWSVNADFLWRRRNATAQSVLPGLPIANGVDAVILEEQLTTYSFGYLQTNTTTTLEAMHFAELAVYVSRHFGKWAIDAGGMVTAPLLAKTQVERNESSTLNSTATTTASVTKYESNLKQAGNSILPGLVAGINFEPFRNLSVGIRGTYTLSQNNYTLSFSNVDQEPLILNRSLSPFSADLRVKWFF